EGVRLAVRAAPDARVQLRTDDGDVIAFVPDTLPGEPAWGVRAFGTDTAAYHLPPPTDRYVAWLPAQPLCHAVLEVSAGGDTARAEWPLVLDTLDRSRPLVVALHDDTAGTGETDSLTVGKAVPYGTYHWFFPTGTRAVVTGRWNDQVRLQLSRTAVAWVNAADVVPLPPGTPPPGGVVGSVRLVPGEETGAGKRSLVLRVPLPDRVPFRVDEGERSLSLRLYGVASDINWMQHGGSDPYVARLSYAQPAADEVVITLTLAGRVWGYRTRWSGRDLLLEIRRPPAIDRRRPLAGRTVVLDPGHPPIGATGPSGLREPVATLAVAEKARALLERAGARVLLTRTDTTPV
ncbi:MAG: N-acetylmuramoyl-L-alanine amidase family protein, partial [Gemmatimonadales bacterium]